MSLIDKTATFSMDWCPSCALAHVESSNIAYRMFAWIAIITLKNYSGITPKEKLFQVRQVENHIIFDLNLESLKQHEAIKDVINDINYWSFLPGFLQVQLDNNDIEFTEYVSTVILENLTLEVIFKIN